MPSYCAAQNVTTSERTMIKVSDSASADRVTRLSLHDFGGDARSGSDKSCHAARFDATVAALTSLALGTLAITDFSIRGR